MSRSLVYSQFIPLAVAAVIFLVLSESAFAQVHFINSVSPIHISEQIRPLDLLIGMTIYLKTSVDFAIFIGNFMAVHRGWKSRIAIETGTALGNAVGTLLILALWDFFHEIYLVLVAVIILASFVLLRLSQDSLEDTLSFENSYPQHLPFLNTISKVLARINLFTDPLLSRVVPRISLKRAEARNFWPLLGVSFTVPFILGLDGFAGYVPLFNIINILGFAIGTFAAHLVLNAFLFLSPDRTVSFVKHPVISYLGGLAFIGLAIFGFYEALHSLI